MDSELDRTLNVWDEQSRAEYEQFLDSLPEDEEAYQQWVESKELGSVADREAHGRRKEF